MCPQTRKYYTIIVHYGSSGSTNAALASLANCQLPPDDIIVVDNARQLYNSPENVKHRLIRPGRNTGYAGGINTGIGALASRGAAEDDIVVVMNNDISIPSGAFRKLRKWWQTHPADSLLGVSGGHINLRTGRTYPHQPASRAHHLGYIDGAFLAAPYSVFLKTKGFPGHYFMYWEDALFSTRVRRLGLPLRIIPDTQLHHQSFSDTDKNSDKLYYLVRNGALFLEQETPLPWRLYWYLANRARLVYHTTRPHGSPIVRRALFDAVRGITGPRKKQ
ncbi:MAG: glycosyltransferase family 2 protein [bacterium]